MIVGLQSLTLKCISRAKFAKQYNFGKILGRWHAFKLN